MSEQANGLTEPKLFPILLGYEAKQIGPHPTCIPWSVAELAYSSYVRQFGRCQTLERIADRGGFSPNEMDEFVPDWRERSSEITSLRARAEQAERDRDVLAAEVRAWRSVDKSAWEFSVDLLQARSNTDASAALTRAGEVKS